MCLSLICDKIKFIPFSRQTHRSAPTTIKITEICKSWLFCYDNIMNKQIKNAPLADRMRPEKLEDFLGQDEIIGAGKLLRQAVLSDKLPSMIFC